MHISVESSFASYVISSEHIRLRVYHNEYRVYDGSTATSANAIDVTRQEYERIEKILNKLNKEEVRKLADEISNKTVREEFKSNMNGLMGLEV